ncbi:MAG: DNA (cytosine-5-)-methyltransferase, partial [Nitrospinae bacterium]|nr:DNA (cytosine-5-)-methyltransferase [Nitrospinota bacterium]
MSKLTFLDVFAGSSALSESCIRADFEPIAHVETDQAACFTIRTRATYHWLKNNGQINKYLDYLNGKISRNDLYSLTPKHIADSVINGVISKEQNTEIFHRIDSLLGNRKLDLLIGGPPCQAYSLVGRSRDKNRMVGDERNYLYIQYAEFLKRYNPQYFLFENVVGLLSAKTPNGNSYLVLMVTLFKSIGYEVEYEVLCANEYGVPQKRKRVILVGKRGKKTGFFPSPEKWTPKDLSIKEVFDDLPKLNSGEGLMRGGEFKDYKGTYLYDSGIRNGKVPVTFHTARPHTEQDKEI